jgi:hypothetical protein
LSKFFRRHFQRSAKWLWRRRLFTGKRRDTLCGKGIIGFELHTG